jgi:16S rRNA (guanine966-N2)-methyltransferase
MTRIIAGTHGGRRLSAPAGAQTRPTSDRVREAFFSTLDTIVDLTGARFADLYAGSGAVGLEALSRGADRVLLVESEAKAARVIRDNIVALRAGAAARLVTGKVLQVLAGTANAGTRNAGPPNAGTRNAGPPNAGTSNAGLPNAGPPDGGPYDVVFADPPYAVADAEVTEMQLALVTHGWLAPDAVVVVERSTRGAPLTWVDGITADRSRRYGETTLWYGRRS